MVLVDIFEIHKIRQVLSEIVNGDFFEIYKIPNSIKSLMRCNLAWPNLPWWSTFSIPNWGACGPPVWTQSRADIPNNECIKYKKCQKLTQDASCIGSHVTGNKSPRLVDTWDIGSQRKVICTQEKLEIWYPTKKKPGCGWEPEVPRPRLPASWVVPIERDAWPTRRMLPRSFA